ncbi:gamma-glutamylcyclotransferase family protein [Methylophaga sp.]|uniref:gamma-glutamylcyclotransferase family protein n=1 Tax=Methylophaga sp. TaxID=2024840 RepID=UPI003F698A15
MVNKKIFTQYNQGRCLYFAYGSNMSVRRLKQRLPNAEIYCRATLNKHALRFHKKSHVDSSAKCDACITGKSTDSVHGVLYILDVVEKPKLDAVEGVGHGYDTKKVTVVDEQGNGLEAYIYIATDIDAKLKPYDWYKHHVLIGAKENNLPDEYISQIAAVTSIADPDQKRLQLELAIYD